MRSLTASCSLFRRTVLPQSSGTRLSACFTQNRSFQIKERVESSLSFKTKTVITSFPSLSSAKRAFPTYALPFRALAAKSKKAEEVEEILGDEEEDAWDEDSDVEDDADDVWVIDTADTKWGQRALDCVNQVLAEIREETGLIEIYSFRITPASFKVDIRLDKAEDKFGSPTMEDLSQFSRLLNKTLEENDAPEDIWVNVSSPGAERRVKIPEEFTRFEHLPMKVQYMEATDEGDEGMTLQTKYLAFTGLTDEGTSTWHLADVRINRPDGKGRKLSKKKLAAEIVIPISNIKQVNLHLDV